MYLVEEQLSTLLFPHVHHLHGHLPPAELLSGDADHTCRTFTDLHKVLQRRSRVPRVHHHLQRRLELVVTHLWRAAIRRCRRCGRLLGGGGGGGVSRGACGGGAGLVQEHRGF